MGSYLAERLSDRGWKVRLYEKNPRRHVVCGGLVNNNTLLKFPFLEEYAIHRIDGAIISAGNEEILVERRGVAWVLDRDQMFRGMIERAQSSGAEVIFREWKGKTNQRVLVGADGALSKIRPMISGEHVKYVLGFQGTAKWNEDEHYVRVDFGEWSPNFFGWVIPLGDGNAHIGIGLPLEKSGEAKNYLRLYGRRLGVKITKTEGRVIPISRPLRRVARENVVLVGDAGVYTKASTGGGITYGLLSMESFIPIIEEYLAGEGMLEEINKIHRKHFYTKLKLHWALHRFYNEVSMEEVIRNLREEGVHEFLQKKGDMDDPSWIFSYPILRFTFRTFFPVLKILPELL